MSAVMGDCSGGHVISGDLAHSGLAVCVCVVSAMLLGSLEHDHGDGSLVCDHGDWSALVIGEWVMIGSSLPSCCSS